MKQNKLMLVLSFVMVLSMVLTACAPAATTKAVNLNEATLDQIIEGAKKEGHVESVGMPDSWANWGETWQELTAEYGITHADTDMSSAEELNMFENEKDAPTKDIGDIGLGFTAE